MSVTHGLKQTSKQKPGIQMGIYQQRYCQFEQNGTEKVEQNEGRLSDFLDSTGPDLRAMWLQM